MAREQSWPAAFSGLASKCDWRKEVGKVMSPVKIIQASPDLKSGDPLLHI